MTYVFVAFLSSAVTLIGVGWAHHLEQVTKARKELAEFREIHAELLRKAGQL